jgi:hypothetical protein
MSAGDGQSWQQNGGNATPAGRDQCHTPWRVDNLSYGRTFDAVGLIGTRRWKDVADDLDRGDVGALGA